MGVLTREQLLAKQELKIEEVDLGNGIVTYVKEMTGHARDQLETSMREEVVNEEGEVSYKARVENFRSKLVVATVCDAEGNLLLTPEDIDTLSCNMGAERLDRIATAASRLNGITKKDRDEILKNSESGQTDSGNLENVES